MTDSTVLLPPAITTDARPYGPAEPTAAEKLLALVPGMGGQRQPVALNHALPRCPLCAAPALAGYAHARADDLAHACRCDIDAPGAYFAGLRRIWRESLAPGEFRATLPERFHTASMADYLGTTTAPLAAALVKLPTTAFLYGPTGAGKTHLAAFAGLGAARGGLMTRYMLMNDLLAAARGVVSGGARPDYRTADVLIVDDLGKQKATEFSYELIYTLANARWADGKTTIYTSNHDPLATARLLTPGDMFDTPADHEQGALALASRFSAGVRYNLTGIDRRLGAG